MRESEREGERGREREREGEREGERERERLTAKKVLLSESMFSLEICESSTTLTFFHRLKRFWRHGN